MIDFLLKYPSSTEEIAKFLSNIFASDKKKILVIHINEFNDINFDINFNDLSCLCVYSEVIGDASLLVQLYRYSMDDDVLLENIMKASKETGIGCYIPIDDFDGWILTGDGFNDVRCKQIDSDETNEFYFKLMPS